MKFLQNKYVKIGLFALIVIIAAVQSFKVVPFSNTEANGYDEQMWTSASISSYNMYFKGYVRPTKQLDNWLSTYAWQENVDIFTGEKWDVFKPDTVQFPYDFVTIKDKKQQYSILVKYDTLKFPRTDFQWYDKDTWTFGWKAPNFGKYIMGWWIQTFAKSKPDPKGYFELFVPSSLADSGSTSYTPSTKPSPAPYSYAPEEYQLLARQPNAIMNFLTVALVFLIGWLFFNYWIGFISGAWLAFNGTFTKINSVAGLDSPAVFFSTLAFLLFLFTIKALFANDKWWKIIVWGVLTGLTSAFAVSSKLNAGMMVIIEAVIFGIIGLLSLYKALRLKKLSAKEKFMPLLKILVAGALTGIISISLFIKLNPQVQHQPKERIAALRGSVDAYFDKRAQIFTINQITDRLRAASDELVRLSKEPATDSLAMMQRNQQYVVINNQIVQLSQAYIQEIRNNALDENSFHLKKSDRYLKDLTRLEDEVQKLSPSFEPNTEFTNWVAVKHQWPKAFNLVMKRIAIVDPNHPDIYYGTFGSILKVKYNLLDGLFAIIGLLFCFAGIRRQWKKDKQVYTYGILGISFLLIFYGNVDFVWQDWPRYMTPIFPLYALMIALGLYEGIVYVKKRITESKLKKEGAEKPAPKKSKK